MFNVGWYHRHPNLTVFSRPSIFATSLGFKRQIPPQLGWSMIMYNFKDPDDLGFEAYRLDDPAQGTMSDYHEVNWMVESPEAFRFIKMRSKV